MTIADLKQRLLACADALRAEGIAHLAVFGSRARGDALDDSDVDVLVDIVDGAPFSLLNLSGVALLLEDNLGMPAQVVLRRSAPPECLKRIEDDLVQVF